MKTLKTWEMIKELTEDQKKKYKIKNYEWIEQEYYCQVESDVVCMHGGKVAYYQSKNTLRLGFAILNAEWEKVIEPVDYITALKKCKETGQKYKGAEYEEERMFRSVAGVVIQTKSEDKVVCVSQDWIAVDRF